MNYGKLTLAVTAGILLAAAVVGVVIELPAIQRRRHAQQERDQRREFERKWVGDGTPYAHYLKLVSGKLASVEQATTGYCTDTAWAGATPERQKELFAECETATRKRMTDDLTK